MNIILSHKIRTLCFVLAIVFLAQGAQAQTPAASPCDPNYYDSLEARAWLEAQREITQNQNLISKPDSVLQYTCFDKQLNHLAQEAANMFSDNKEKWGSKADMQKALQGLVGSAISSYIGGNFNHPMMGGRLTTVGYAPGAVSKANYNCNVMNNVWQTAANTAKCRNFNAIPAQDGFFTFSEYAGSPDKRQLPAACTTNISATWTSNINKALVASGTTWTEDDVVTYLDRMDPANCGAAANPPIETGLTVIRNQSPSNYAEKVCVTPGCHYDPSLNKCQP